MPYRPLSWGWAAALPDRRAPKERTELSCTVVDNNDGTKTITCPDTAPVTIANGSPGSSCTVKDNGDGTSTITCTDNTTTTVKNGTSCSVVDICITCHTSGAEDMNSTDMADPTPQTIDFKVMVHKLHNGAHLPSVQGLTTAANGSRVYGTGTPYVVGTKDFSGVNFPSFPNARIAMPKDSGYSALSAANKTKDDNVRKGVTLRKSFVGSTRFTPWLASRETPHVCPRNCENVPKCRPGLSDESTNLADRL